MIDKANLAGFNVLTEVTLKTTIIFSAVLVTKMGS